MFRNRDAAIGSILTLRTEEDQEFVQPPHASWARICTYATSLHRKPTNLCTIRRMSTSDEVTKYANSFIQVKAVASQQQVNIHVNFSYRTKLARLRDISITSTTNPPATSRKRVNDESAPEEPPAKRTKKSNPRGGVVKKGVEVETRFEVSLSSQAQVNLVQVDLYGSSLTGLWWSREDYANVDLAQVNLAHTHVETSWLVTLTWNSAGWIQYQFATSGQIQFYVANFNGNGNAKPSDGK
ncbi:hypothetical protein B0H13DRAFT_1935589 [Mycena leptocephala]|nr:hypothetical protein B0H13DRAFT_1935589 [Mycena leptocephala]